MLAFLRTSRYPISLTAFQSEHMCISTELSGREELSSSARFSSLAVPRFPRRILKASPFHFERS